jgi:hypothetical protein
MIGTRRTGVRYLGVVVASVLALNLYTPLSSASATVPPTTCVCSITLHPVSGPRVTSVTITGAGWTHGATVTLQFVDAALVRTSFASATADSHGAFTKTVTIPGTAAYGHGWVVAATTTLKTRAEFLVTKGCATKAAITLQPASGKRSSNVTVAGSGFCPSTRVRIRFRDSKLNWTLLAQGVTVGTGGNFSKVGMIPANAAIGDGYVAVYDSASKQTAKKLFTVKP